MGVVEGLPTEDVAEKIMAAIKNVQKNMTRLNIMVMGKTGAGKSTLINQVFSRNLAVTGVGKPVTQAIRKYELEDFPLAIYDTPGLELGGENAKFFQKAQCAGSKNPSIASGTA